MAQLLDHTADKTLFLSRILLRTSLSKVGSPVLFLGGIAELVWPGLRVLALIATDRLEASQVALLSETTKRILLPSPFDYLNAQLLEAWHQSPRGEALNFLAARHAMALHFETPVERPVPWYLSMLLPRSKEPALRELRGVAAAVPNRPLLESVLAATP